MVQLKLNSNKLVLDKLTLPPKMVVQPQTGVDLMKIVGVRTKTKNEMIVKIKVNITNMLFLLLFLTIESFPLKIGLFIITHKKVYK